MLVSIGRILEGSWGVLAKARGSRARLSIFQGAGFGVFEFGVTATLPRSLASVGTYHNRSSL